MSRIGIIRYPGSNCDSDTFRYFDTPETPCFYIWHKETELPSDLKMIDFQYNNDTSNVIVSPSPNVTFTVSDTLGCSPLPVVFTNTTQDATNCIWDLGVDGTFNNCGTFSYTCTGSYPVYLVIPVIQLL